MAALASSSCTSILGDDFHLNLFPPDSGNPIPDASLDDASIKRDATADTTVRTDGGDASLGPDTPGSDGTVSTDVRRDTPVLIG